MFKDWYYFVFPQDETTYYNNDSNNNNKKWETVISAPKNEQLKDLWNANSQAKSDIEEANL